MKPGESNYGTESLSTERQGMEYQLLKLRKEVNLESSKEGKTVHCLKRASGLELIDNKESNLLTRLSEGECKFLIVIAMYNENPEEVIQTLDGICDNLRHFESGGIPPEEIACIVIVDGMGPFLKVYQEHEFFQRFFDADLIKNRYNCENLLNFDVGIENEYDEIAHCFMQQYESEGNEKLPLNLFWCVKQANKRKLNSHLWYFGGFCEAIQPKYCMLLDVGTKPDEKALFYLFEAMEVDPRVAGCCGEIKPITTNMWNFVVSAQVVEYKFGHIFDKALESIVGYITVLPGAFSAYRWEALQGDSLWQDYFKSLRWPHKMDAFNSNIYLAEDRVLCHSLVCKEGRNNILRYVRQSVAGTDVPDKLPILLAQRRRWINGSWFALIDTLRKCNRICNSNHSCCRKLAICFLMLYYVVNVIFTWLMVGSFYLVFSITVRNSTLGYEFDNVIDSGRAFILLYVAILVLLLILSLSVKPKRIESTLNIISVVLGAYMLLAMFFMANYLASAEFDQEWIAYIMYGSILAFTIIILINNSVVVVLKGVLQFVFLTPTYVNMFLIYSICNVHDCTWGNRPDQLNDDEKSKLEEFEEFRGRWVIVWVLSNGSFAYFLDTLDKINQEKAAEEGEGGNYWIVYMIGLIGAAILCIRFVGGVLFFLDERFFAKILEKDYGKHRVKPHQTEMKLYSREVSFNSTLRRNSSRKTEKIVEVFGSRNHLHKYSQKALMDRSFVYKPRRSSTQNFNQGSVSDFSPELPKEPYGVETSLRYSRNIEEKKSTLRIPVDNLSDKEDSMVKFTESVDSLEENQSNSGSFTDKV